MARILDRRKAIALRQSGKPYSQIRAELGVSKSTLSNWLTGVLLTDVQIKDIKKQWIDRRVETYIKTTKLRRQKIFENYCEIEKKNLLPLTDRELLIAGLFLYLGEGAKSDWFRVQISNTDPSIIKFSIVWLTKVFRIPKRELKIQLHLYSDMDIEKEIKFWQNTTGFNRDQFIKPYIKKSSSQKIDHPSFGHGTCNIYIGRVGIKHKIMAGIKIILDSVNAGL